jgi:hypothetical protein
VSTIREKLCEPSLRERGRIRRRDANGIESMFVRGARERRPDVARIRQKSRSA